MSVKVAINGFGRIGRCVARILSSRDDIELVAVNDTAEREMTKYLLKYDSVHGVFDGEVEILEDDYMQMGKNRVKMFSDRDPANLKFADFGAQIVLECTGAILTIEKAQGHINAGAKRVIFSAPAKDDTPTFVIGVNHETYANQAIISNASCTTNCLGPVTKVLDDEFGIEKALMTTIHSYTSSQPILDAKQKKGDMRRARAGAMNMGPTTTGAAKAIGLVMPQLKGKIHGMSVRVPTPNVSLVDLNALVKKDVTKEEINLALQKASEGSLKGILGFDEEYRVSQDFLGCVLSSIVASDVTQVIDGNLVKVMAWYDNEWGYSSRLVDMAAFVGKRI